MNPSEEKLRDTTSSGHPHAVWLLLCVVFMHLGNETRNICICGPDGHYGQSVSAEIRTAQSLSAENEEIHILRNTLDPLLREVFFIW